MSYISVKEASEKWGITERVVRQYCAERTYSRRFYNGKDLEYSRYSRETRQKTEAEKSA